MVTAAVRRRRRRGRAPERQGEDRAGFSVAIDRARKRSTSLVTHTHHPRREGQCIAFRWRMAHGRMAHGRMAHGRMAHGRMGRPPSRSTSFAKRRVQRSAALHFNMCITQYVSEFLYNCR